MKENLNLTGLASIRPEDFQHGGRLAHVYIGRQCKIPPEVLRILDIGNPENSDQVQAIWRPLYAARLKAAEDYRARITVAQRIKSPWLELLCDDSIPKDFEYDEIDKTQYAAAWERYDFTKLQMTGAETLYNIFIRPLERLFVADMPMNQKLLEALQTKDGTTDLATYIIKLVGWDAPPFKLEAPKMVEELSKIRALRTRDLRKTHPMDMPVTTLRRQACKPFPDNTYDRESAKERARRLGCEDEMLFQSQSKENLDDLLESITSEIRNLMVRLENNTEEIETIQYQQKHTKEPAGLRKLEEKKEQIQADIANTRENLTRKWRDYRLTSERRNQLTYRPEKTTEQTRQELMKKTPQQLRGQLKHAQEEYRSSFKNLRELKETYKSMITSRFNFFSQKQAEVITSMTARIQTQERHLKELDTLSDAIIVAINKKEEEKRAPAPPKHGRGKDEDTQISVKVPRTNWLIAPSTSSNSDIRYPDMSTPKESLTDTSMASVRPPQQTLYPSLKEMQRAEAQKPKSTGTTPKQPQTLKTILTKRSETRPTPTPRRQVKHPAQNSWMEAQPHRDWPQTIKHWPTPGNRNQPEWTKQKGSIRDIQDKNTFLTLKDVLDINETPRLVSFHTSAGSYRNKVTISINSYNTKKDHVEIPLGLLISQESTYMNGEGRPVARRVTIPQALIEGVETTLKVYENLKMSPLATEMNKKYKEDNHISHVGKFGKVDTRTTTENEDQQKYRAIIIEHTKKATGETGLVRIPWIHLPIFNHYYEQMSQEVRMIIARYEAKKGPNSFEKLDPEQKLREDNARH